MAKKEDPRFEEFLKKQFTELRNELAKFPAPGTARDGKLLQLTQVPQAKARSTKGIGSWKYGIAAAVVVAIAVPSIIRFNQQKAELASKTESPFNAPREEKKENDIITKNSKTVPTDADETEERQRFFAAKKRIAGKEKGRAEKMEDALAGERSDGNVKTAKEEAPRLAMGKAESAKNEGAKDSGATIAREQGEAEEARSPRSVAQAGASADEKGYLQSQADKSPAAKPAAPAAPAAAPAPTRAMKKSAEISAAPPATESVADDRAAASTDTPAQLNQRSVAVDDAKTRLKKQDVSDEEKAEMEKLWREFEKNPQAFNKDKARRARLDTLLSRHDRKARAKRMRALESQKAY